MVGTSHRTEWTRGRYCQIKLESGGGQGRESHDMKKLIVVPASLRMAEVRQGGAGSRHHESYNPGQLSRSFHNMTVYHYTTHADHRGRPERRMLMYIR